MPFLPFDFQSLPALNGGPGIGGDNGHAAQWIETGRGRTALKRNNSYHTRDLHCFNRAVTGQPVAKGGRAGNHRVEHPFQAGIDAVLAAAGHNISAVVKSGFAFSDITKIGRIFQLQAVAGGHGQFRGGTGELAVTQAFSRSAGG